MLDHTKTILNGAGTSKFGRARLYLLAWVALRRSTSVGSKQRKQVHSPGGICTRQAAHRKQGRHRMQLSMRFLGAQGTSASSHGSLQLSQVSLTSSSSSRKGWRGVSVIVAFAIKIIDMFAALSSGGIDSTASHAKCIDCLGTLNRDAMLMVRASDAIVKSHSF